MTLVPAAPVPASDPSPHAHIAPLTAKLLAALAERDGHAHGAPARARADQDVTVLAAALQAVALTALALPPRRAPRRRVPVGDGPTLTGSAACRLIGVSPVVLWRALQAGELPATRNGWRWSISRADLAAWDERRRGGR